MMGPDYYAPPYYRRHIANAIVKTLLVMVFQRHWVKEAGQSVRNISAKNK